MGQALYRKYRSKSLDEIVGQEHITATLSNALKQGNISHAYLFTGPRGVGKTSIARILAYEVNSLPYDEEATHLDIIEIDAASNRRIDEIRELREKVHAAPSSAKYKVYIIDEVHMLTREAFNALLKTLEEPPAHAIFILATTEAHKVPDTITSRTQRFAFKPISTTQQVAHLRVIAKQEKVKIDDAALELIAAHSGGSFRDSISLLDQARTSGDQITLETVQNILGIAPAEAIERLTDLIKVGSIAQILKHLEQIKQNGYQAAQLAAQLSQALRGQLLQSTSAIESIKLSELLYKLLAVPASHDPMSLLELILLEAAISNNHQPGAEARIPAEKYQDVTPPAPTDTLSEESKQHQKKQYPVFNEKKNQTNISASSNGQESSLPDDSFIAASGAFATSHTAEANKPATKAHNQTEDKSQTGTALDNESWKQVLQAIKNKHNTLYSIARIAVPTFTDKEIILSFNFPFHQKRFNDAKTRQLVSDMVLKQTGKQVTITCIIAEADGKAPAVKQPTALPPDDVLSSISNIFGDAEVLE